MSGVSKDIGALFVDASTMGDIPCQFHETPERLSSRWTGFVVNFEMYPEHTEH